MLLFSWLQRNSDSIWTQARPYHGFSTLSGFFFCSLVYFATNDPVMAFGGFFLPLTLWFLTPVWKPMLHKYLPTKFPDVPDEFRNALETEWNECAQHLQLQTHSGPPPWPILSNSLFRPIHGIYGDRQGYKFRGLLLQRKPLDNKGFPVDLLLWFPQVKQKSVLAHLQRYAWKLTDSSTPPTLTELQEEAHWLTLFWQRDSIVPERDHPLSLVLSPPPDAPLPSYQTADFPSKEPEFVSKPNAHFAWQEYASLWHPLCPTSALQLQQTPRLGDLAEQLAPYSILPTSQGLFFHMQRQVLIPTKAAWLQKHIESSLTLVRALTEQPDFLIHFGLYHQTKAHPKQSETQEVQSPQMLSTAYFPAPHHQEHELWALLHEAYGAFRDTHHPSTSSLSLRTPRPSPEISRQLCLKATYQLWLAHLTASNETRLAQALQSLLAQFSKSKDPSIRTFGTLLQDKTRALSVLQEGLTTPKTLLSPWHFRAFEQYTQNDPETPFAHAFLQAIRQLLWDASIQHHPLLGSVVHAFRAFPSKETERILLQWLEQLPSPHRYREVSVFGLPQNFDPIEETGVLPTLLKLLGELGSHSSLEVLRSRQARWSRREQHFATNAILQLQERLQPDNHGGLILSESKSSSGGLSLVEGSSKLMLIEPDSNDPESSSSHS